MKNIFYFIFAMLFAVEATANAKPPSVPRGFAIEHPSTVVLSPACITQTGNRIIVHPFNGIGAYSYGYSYGYPTGTLWWLGGERNFDGFIIYTPLQWWTDNDYKKEEAK